jgi:carbon-monoxide dehydrogenase small subunit
MMATAIAFLKHNPDPTEAQIRDALSGNMCRCTGYNNIVKAVQQAAAELSAPPSEPPAPEPAVAS